MMAYAPPEDAAGDGSYESLPGADVHQATRALSLRQTSSTFSRELKAEMRK